MMIERPAVRSAKRVYLLPMHHDTPKNAEVALKDLSRIGERENKLVIALETNNDKNHRMFLRNLIHKSDQEIDEFSSLGLSFGDFEAALLKGLRQLSHSYVRRVYPIAVGKEDACYKEVDRLMKSLFEVKPIDGTPQLENLVDVLVRRMMLVNQIGVIRDPIMLTNIKNVVAEVDRPVVVIIGEGHIPYMQSNITGAEVSVIERERNAFDKAMWGFMDTAEHLLRPEGVSEGLLVSLSKVVLVQGIRAEAEDPAFGEMVQQIDKVKSTAEAKAVFDKTLSGLLR